ncbi:MAG: ribonuclease E/G, partial [Bacteroidota bacterium]
MNSELIIDSSASEVQIALLEDRRIVEFNSEKKDNSFSVGDIYLGRIRKIMPGLNAAFVDVGHDKDAFLHYLDLGPQYLSLMKFTKEVAAGGHRDGLLNGFSLEKDLEKGGKVNGVLAANQWIPVQIAKEPISTKGPRITCDLSMAGRFVVMVPFT